MDLVQRAKAIAEKAHEGVTYGNLPYIVHPADVVQVLIEFGHTDPVIIALGWLHDVIEDTEEYTVVTLAEELGDSTVARLVDNVSVDKTLKNRKEKNAAVYPKIRSDIRSVIGKLADRISNVRASLRSNSSTLGMYRKEHPEFRAALYSPNQLTEPMWKELDSLLNS